MSQENAIQSNSKTSLSHAYERQKLRPGMKNMYIKKGSTDVIIIEDERKFEIQSQKCKSVSQQAKAQPRELQLQPNKTFIEEESLELYEPCGPQQENQIPLESSISKKDAIVQLSEIKSKHKQMPTFCDKLILQKLEETLEKYQEDLTTLSQNKDFIEEQIATLSQKISKLTDTEQQNQHLHQQIQEHKDQLRYIMTAHHHTEVLLYRKQIQQQEQYNLLRKKLRIVINELKEDYHYIGFVQYWNQYLNSTIDSHQTVNQMVKNNSQSNTQPSKIGSTDPQKQLKVEEQAVCPGECKPKKRLSEAEKASLLGDLKSFSRTFKLPPS